MAKKLLLISVLLIVLQESTSIGFGKVADATNLFPFNPTRLLQWSTFSEKSSETGKRGKRQTNEAEKGPNDQTNPVQELRELVEKIDTMDSYFKSSAQIQKPEDDFRDRRESDKPMEKIGGVKTVDRQLSAKRSDSSAESWSKQPIAIEFKHRSSADEAYLPTEDPADYYGNHQPPKIDFVTSTRRFYSGEREGRELPGQKQTYDDYDMHPMFRDYSSRGRDYQIPISRAMYPNRYKGDRDYYYRVPLDMRMKMPRPGVIPSPSFYNRYRLDTESEDQYMDAYGRIPPTKPPKPKRIIYYATLPEIVRKPVDIRNYPRYNSPFPQPSRIPNIDRNGNRIRPISADPTRRPYNKISYPVIYKYSNLDSWSKRPNQYEQIPQDHFSRDEERRDQERIKENKNNFMSSENMSDENKQSSVDKMMNNDPMRTPWLMQAASEDNVHKGNERNTERNPFNREQNFDSRNMYQNSKNKGVIMDQEMSDT